MASQTREALKAWLSTLEVKGRVLDVGGIAWPIRNQIIDKGITDYKILDRRSERKGVKTDFIYDLNLPFTGLFGDFDVAFCTEVMQFLYNPYQALRNMSYLLKPQKGILYISFHLTHPPMKDTDYLRYTKLGAERLLEETGFKIEYLIEPFKGYYLVKAYANFKHNGNKL